MRNNSGGYNIWRDEDLKKIFDALDHAQKTVGDLEKKIKDKDEEISGWRDKMNNRNITLIIM